MRSKLLKKASIPITQLKSTLENWARSRFATREIWQKYWSNSYKTYESWMNSEGGLKEKLQEYKESKDRVKIRFFATPHEDDIESLKVLLKKIGWGPTKWSSDNTIFLMKNRPENMRVQVPRFLYHFSRIENTDKILRNGLRPNSSFRDEYIYRDRVYLLTKYDESNIARLAYAVGNYDNPDNDWEVEVVVFEIDSSMFEASYYEDVDSTDAVWTKTPIPSKAIKIKSYMDYEGEFSDNPPAHEE